MQNVQSLNPQNYTTKIDVATSDCYIKPNITKDNEKLVMLVIRQIVYLIVHFPLKL